MKASDIIISGMLSVLHAKMLLAAELVCLHFHVTVCLKITRSAADFLAEIIFIV